MRHELISYRASISGRTFDVTECRIFWRDAQVCGQFPHLGRIARLFLTVPASAIPQERQFSELKRRSAMLRNRTKVETMDRDAVVFLWKNAWS